METHCPSEVEPVIGWMLEVGEIPELVINRTTPPQGWGQDMRVFKDVPTQTSHEEVVGTAEHVRYGFFCSEGTFGGRGKLR